MSDFFRQWHRWLSLLVGLFMAVIASTGILLAVEMIVYPPDALPPQKASSGPEPILDRQMAETLLGRAFSGTAQISRVGIGSIRNNFAITTWAPDGKSRTMDADGASISGTVDSGAAPSPVQFGPAAGPNSLHRFLINLHSGYMIKPWGSYLSVCCGLTLLFLSLSGLWMYANMFRRRLKLGRRNPFW